MVLGQSLTALRDSLQPGGIWEGKREARVHEMRKVDSKCATHRPLGPRHSHSPRTGAPELSGPRLEMTSVKLA